MVNEKLKVGDKYLSVKLVGHSSVAAFKNLKKSKPEDPDYTGNGIAIWITTKKEASKSSPGFVSAKNYSSPRDYVEEDFVP